MPRRIEHIPFSRHLGMQLVSAADGRSSCTVPMLAEHLNSSDHAHGGLIFALADTCMGQALRTVLEQDDRAATLEAKISYFRPGTGSELRSESQVVHRGRQFVSLECRVFAGDKLVASVSSTFAVSRAVTTART